MQFKQTGKTILDCSKMVNVSNHYIGMNYIVKIGDKYHKILSVYEQSFSDKFLVYCFESPDAKLGDKIERYEMSGNVEVYLPEKLGRN